MHAPYVEIIRSDGRVTRHLLGGGRTTIGRDADADIALEDAPELEPLHLLLDPREDGCWVSVARTARTPAHRTGAVFENGLLPWGTELDIGAVTLRLDRAEARRSRARLAGPLRKVVMLAACLWVASRVVGGPPAGPPRSQVPAPELFDDVGSAGCPAGDADARARANEAAEAAQAKAERYPFSPHDGVVAVTLWSVAASCLAAAGDPEGAAATRIERDQLRERVEDDYRAHRLALERSLDHREYSVALAETRVVGDLVRDHDGDYLRWLIRLERSLIEELAKQKEHR